MSEASISASNPKERFSSVAVSFPGEPEEEKVVSIAEELEEFKNFVNSYSIQAEDIWEGQHSLKVEAFIELLSQKMGY